MNIIEIIGKTNSGKSSLFNRLIEKRISIVDETKNTTRDYIRYFGKNFILIDNMGYEKYSSLNNKIFEASIIIYVIDYENFDDIDKSYIKELNKKKKNFIVVINKCDKDQKDIFIPEVKNIFFISVKKNIGINELKNFLNIKEENSLEKKTTIALLGGVNSGKSSILNLLCGYERSKVSKEAATTRDFIQEEINNYIFFDTAGFNQIDKKIEKIALQRTREVMLNVDICIIVVDISQFFTKWNKWLWQECEKLGKGIIFIFNKMDLMDNMSIKKEYFLQLTTLKPYLPYLFFSIYSNSLIKNLFNIIKKVELNLNKKISKYEIKNFLENINIPNNINRINISEKQHHEFYVYTKKNLDNNYKKYLENQFIKYFNFFGKKPNFFFKLISY